ncbi:MAG: TonB family protein [Alphaproteobacteria bacterium]|nr:TonB family protein [Alphaproteobacteria bacterium]
MAGGAALLRTDRGFALRAALLSLGGHAAAFLAVAAFLANPAPPEPAPVYAVIFEAASQPARGEPLERIAREAAAAPAAPAAEPPPQASEHEPAPPVVEAPIPELPAETPLKLATVEDPKPAPKPRPKPSKVQKITPAPQPAPPVAEPAEIAAPAPSPGPSPVPAEVAAVEGAGAATSAPAAQSAEAPAPAAGPAPVPVVTEARFQSPPAPPVYPRRAVELGQRGIAVLRALVQPDGSTSEIVLWRSSGFVLLDDAALGAVRRWRFEPARRDGGAILAWVEIPVRFEFN